MLDNQLVKIENVFDPSKKDIISVPCVPGTKIAEFVKLANLGESVVVLVNGKEITDLSKVVMPGDIVCVIPRLHGDDTGKIVMMLAVVVIAIVAPYALSVTSPMWAGLMSAAIMTAGGLLINSMFPPPAVSSPFGPNQIEDSPTYGWNAGTNTSRIDIPIPVIYGEVKSYPQIINFYIEIDSSGNQWAHWLLCCGEGLINNTPDESDIYVGDILLESFDPGDYDLYVTDGSTSPSTGQLTKFQKLHQYREFQQSLFADENVSLLHFNGANGSTTIVEESVFGYNWACYNGAELSTANPWQGTASLDVTGSTDYIAISGVSAQSLSPLDITTSDTWDIEFRFRKSGEVDAGICGLDYDSSMFWSILHLNEKTTGLPNHVTKITSATTGIVSSGSHGLSVDDIVYFANLTEMTELNNTTQKVTAVYNVDNFGIGNTSAYNQEDSGGFCCWETESRLIFQQFEATGASREFDWGDPVDVSGIVYFNVGYEAVLSNDTWYHMRVARSGDTIYLFLDGTLLGSGEYTKEPVPPEYSGTWLPTIGRAYHYTSGPDTITLRYAQAEIDEFNFKNGGLIYESLGSFTPSTSESTLTDLGTNIETKGTVDEITFVINAPQGLYWVKASTGATRELSVYFNFEYRLKGTSTWTTQTGSISGNSRYPIKKEFNYSVAQGEYETRVVRTSGNFPISTWAGRTYWIGLDEILDEFLIYPGLQLVSLSLKAQDEWSGPVPNIGVVNNRSSIVVPNFDGTGTMSVNPSNNAYAAYDILTNDYYGVGVDATRFDEDAWNDWVDWCNGLVATYKRCQFNMIMDSQYDMDQALQHVENTGRAKILMRGSQISVVIEKPGSPSALFSDGNIKQGSAKLSFLPQEERSDAIEIQFKDKDNLWQDNVAFEKTDAYDTLTRVPRIMRMMLPGINNEEQATREAILRLQISEGIKKTTEFESGIEGIVSTLGDIFRFQQEGNQLTIGGRLGADASNGQVRIDKTINLSSSDFDSCKIWIRKEDDSVEELGVAGPFDVDTSVLNVGPSSAKRFDPYIIGHPTQSHYEYKMISMERSSEQNVKIKAVQYVSSSYYHNDYDDGNTAL